MRQPVGTDHGFIELQDARHVILVHAEIDGAGRLQAAHGLLDRTAQLARDLVQVAAREPGWALDQVTMTRAAPSTSACSRMVDEALYG